MARPAPQPDVADLALVGRIGAERLQLRVRQRLAGDADEQDQRAEIILQPQRVAGKVRRDEDREHQRDRAEPLVLQEDEHLARRIDAPFLGERRIARIVRDPRGADRNMRSRAAATRSRPAPRPAIAARWAARRRSATARCRRRPGRARTSRSYRPSRNCRCAAAPARRPPSGPTATRRWPPAPRDTRSSCKNPVWTSNAVTKYADVKAGFQSQVPPTSAANRASQLFSPAALCHIGSQTRLLATDDTRKCPQAPPPAPRWRSN